MADIINSQNKIEASQTQPAPNKVAPPPGVPEGVSYGYMPKSGEVVTTESKPVKEEMTKHPSLTGEVAMGNVMAQEKQKKAITTTNDVRAERDANQKQLEKEGAKSVEETAEPKKPEETGKAENSSLDLEFEKYNKAYEDMKANLDASTQAAIEGIQASYARQRDAMKVANQARMAGLEILGTRTGRQRYASEIQEGILSSEQKAGIQRIAQLDAEEQQMIASAKAANDAKQWDMLNQRMNQAMQIRQQKETEIMNQFQMSAKAEEVAIDKAKAAQEDRKFALDYQKFMLEVDKNDFNKALQVAENNGYQVGFDKEGNPMILPQLTIDNQLKIDNFQFQIDKFGWEKTMDTAKYELDQNRLALDQAKFEQDIQEFGLQYAIDAANANLNQQKHLLDLSEKGYYAPTYADLGIAAPTANVLSAASDVLLNDVYQDFSGTTGSMRKEGWECGEFAEQVVNLGTPNNTMGDTLEDKTINLRKYGLMAEEVRENGGFVIGDVIVTNGSDVSSSGKPLSSGHVLVVGGFDKQGNIIALEANKSGDGKITNNRTLSPDSKAIIGIFGRKSGGIKDKYVDNISEKAANSVIEKTTAKLSEQQIKIETDLRKEYQGNQIVKDYNEISQRIGTMRQAMEENEVGRGSNMAVDQTLINAFNKILDNTSVVREAEYARTSSDLSLLHRFKGMIEKGYSGGAGLTDEDRQALIDMAERCYAVITNKYNVLRSDYEKLASDYGADVDRVLGTSMTIYDEDDMNKYNPMSGTSNSRYIVPTSSGYYSTNYSSGSKNGSFAG